MKTIIRLAMVVSFLALPLWVGDAVPAETSPLPESSEYLMTVVRGAPWPLPASLAEAEGEDYGPGDRMEVAIVEESVGPEMVAEGKTPEPETYEYIHAMETGNLPASCAGVICSESEFTIVEIGGASFRVEVDLGGGGE